MRIMPFILIVIGVLGLIWPDKFMAAPEKGGYWVFSFVVVLGLFSLWRMIKCEKKRK